MHQTYIKIAVILSLLMSSIALVLSIRLWNAQGNLYHTMVQVQSQLTDVGEEVFMDKETFVDNEAPVVGWTLRTSEVLGLSFYLPEEYTVSFDEGMLLISMPTGPDDYFPLTSFHVTEGETARAAYLSRYAVENSEELTFETYWHNPNVTYVDQEVVGYPLSPDPYVHRTYIVSNERTGQHFFFSGWEEWSLSNWEYVDVFFKNLRVF